MATNVGLGEIFLNDTFLEDEEIDFEGDGLGEFVLQPDEQEIVFVPEEQVPLSLTLTKDTTLDDLLNHTVHVQLHDIDYKPKSCKQKCIESNRTRERKCKLIRKRVSLSLKKAGCPSQVHPAKIKSKIKRIK